MASTYTTNLGVEKPATGDQAGAWGTTVNTNMDLIDEAINGIVSVTLAAAGTSGAPNDLPITNAASSNGRNAYITFTDGGDLGADVFVQLTPNDAEKIAFIKNNLSGSRDLYLFQGTYDAARDYVLAAGSTALLAFSGQGAGSSTVTEISLVDISGIAALKGRLWTIRNTTLNPLVMGARYMADSHAGITFTLPATFAISATDYSDIWVVNADDASNITLTPASGDALFVSGATLGVDATYAITPGNVVICCPRTTNSEWDVVVVGSVADNAITDTKLRDSAALSVIGRATNSSGDPADMAAGTDGHLLRRSGTTLGFGQLTIEGIPDGLVTLAKMANMATSSLIYRRTAGTGVPEVNTLDQLKTDLNITGTNITAAPSSDTSVSGVTTDMQVGETVTFGQVLYMKSDGKLWKADADVVANQVIAMAAAAINADATGSVLLFGFARNDAWAWTVGGPIYNSTTAGAMTQTAPSGTGDRVQVMGYATHADRMLFKPSPDWIEI